MTTRWARREVLRGAAGLIVASACGGAAAARPSPTAATGTRPDHALAANPGLRIWPEVIARSAPEVREAYDYAARGPRSLQFIPCYCGCGAAGHLSNQDCFVDRFAAGGWVILDLHGYG